jgi:hypothetical protein
MAFVSIDKSIYCSHVILDHFHSQGREAIDHFPGEINIPITPPFASEILFKPES